MKWSGCVCLLATLAVLFLLETSAAPSPRTDDLLKTLQDLEQMYSSMARPRFGKRDRLMNNNGVYRNAETDYADDQSNDDGHIQAGGKWPLDADAVAVRDDAAASPANLQQRQRQLLKLQQLYHYPLN